MWRCAVLLIVGFLFAPRALGADQKSVLILHQGSRLLPYQTLLSNEMQKSLVNAPFDVQIFEEYLDLSRLNLDHPKDFSRSARALEAKYGGRKFDVVVADGGVAFQLMLKEAPEFLRGTPIVFLNVPEFDLPVRLPENVTGVVTHLEFGATVDLAARLQPDLQHLYYVNSSLAPKAVKETLLRNDLVAGGHQIEVVSWEDLALSDLLKRVKSLPPHSAILFDTYVRDPSGRPYIPTDVCSLLAGSANAPIYALYQTNVGRGAVGGVVISFENVGSQGARIVLGLLNGAPISQYPVEHSRNDIMVDWRKMQQFGLHEGNLPASAIVLFRPPTLWEKYSGYIIAAGIVILLQTVLIVELALAGKLRKKSEESARELASRLINAQEEERRRLAAELHDDISQRLALVAIHLDMIRGTPPGSREDLVRELSGLYDEADQLSSDIHQFSHELRPVILERLGLGAALRRYCSEFSAYRKIAVDMSITGDEPQVDVDTALVFFRIGQECLMNAAKHSGATECKVSLTYVKNRIRLAVEDNGSGFEPRRAQAKAGLGIQSMRERLRSIDGRLRIESSRLQGTKVTAEAIFVDSFHVTSESIAASYRSIA